MSVGRQEAFEIFRRDYDQNTTIEENKQTLKQRYAEAKTLGERVNKTRGKISKSWTIDVVCLNKTEYLGSFKTVNG